MSLFSKLSKNNDKTLYPWSQKKLGGSNSALPRVGHAAAAVSLDAFIIYGGIHRTSTKKELFSIDANSHSANSINASGDLPSSRISPVIVAMNGYVLLYGGKPLVPEEKYDGGFYLLNLHSKQWTRIQMEGNHPVERSGHSAVAHDGIMYIWGGQNEGNYFNDLFIFNSSTFKTTPTWEKLNYNNDGPEPRSGHISAIYENKLYIYGGTDGHRIFDDIWSFDLHTGLWLKIDPDGYTPAARESCAAAIVDDVIYIIGGKGEKGAELNDLCAYKIKHRRWFRFQNMGPSPSARHGLTMTAVREKLYVLGGDNETSRLDDSSLLFILDSTKIKYPTDIPPPVQQTPLPVPQHASADPSNNQHNYDTASLEDMSGQQQYYQQQQQQKAGQAPQQQQFQQPYQQHYPDQRQPRLNQAPSSPQQQQPQRSLTTNPKTGNGLHKEIDTSMNYSENNVQPSPTSSSSPSSLTSPRHRSYYPENQNQSLTQPPVRPPRHMSTVPEAALRRPRATSPLPQAESEIAADIRRQYQSPTSPNLDTIHNSPIHGSPIYNGSMHGSPMGASFLSATEDDFIEPQRIMSPHTTSRSSPVAPPPRPPREGVGLGNAQRNTMVNHEDPLRPKSQMPIRNQSAQHSPQPIVPPVDTTAAIPPGHQTPSPQQLAYQQQLANEQALAHEQLAKEQAMAQEQAQLQAQQQAQLQAQQQAQLQAQQQAQLQAQYVAQQEAQKLAQQEAQLLAQKEAQYAQQQAQYQAQHQQKYQAEQVLERSASRQLHPSSPSPIHGKPKQDNAATAAAAVQAATAAATAAAQEERQSLMREIKARDMIISEMKKKENWWRTEVSLARKQRSNKGESFDDGPDADEALLMDIDHIEEDKVKLFEQLVSVKSELRRVRNSILQQAQPMSEKVAQADRMRTAALQEAAYFKSKYLALKSRRQDEIETLDISRCDELEKRLAAALTENESTSKLLQQLQKRSQHDQTSRVATEERAREAQERAEEAQQAHQRALEELQVVYSRATKAELQVRENAVKIADLTQQLSDALMAQPIVKSQEVTEAQLKASQLEAANLKARNETAGLKQRLAENMDEIARLRTVLNEREDALGEAKIHVEDCEIQLSMMREAMNQQHQKSSVNGFSPTRAY